MTETTKHLEEKKDIKGQPPTTYLGLANSLLFCDLLTAVQPTTKQFCNFFNHQKIYLNYSGLNGGWVGGVCQALVVRTTRFFFF